MKEMVTCRQGRSWSAEVWLLLAVMSSSSGFLVSFSRVLGCPWSWYATVISIIIYRFLLSIKPEMPILVDMSGSLFLQWVVSCWGDYGWNWGFTMTVLLIAVIFSTCCFFPLIDEYQLLKQLQPGSLELLKQLHPESNVCVELVSPLSPVHFASAMFSIYFLNGGLMLMTWFYPLHGKFSCSYEDFLGIVLVLESLVFISCYEQLSLRKDDPSMERGRGTTLY